MIRVFVEIFERFKGCFRDLRGKREVFTEFKGLFYRFFYEIKGFLEIFREIFYGRVIGSLEYRSVYFEERSFVLFCLLEWIMN